MQISLNQNEIEAGIKMYIESRGINLHGREVAMDFTAQRKGNAGINVDVDLGEDSFFSPSETETHTRPVHHGHGTNNTVVTLTASVGVSAKRTPAPVVEPVEQAAPEEPVKRTRKAKVEAVEPEAPTEPEVKEEEAPAEEPVSELTQPQPETPPVVDNPNSLFGGATVASIPAANEATVPATEPAMSKSLFG